MEFVKVWFNAIWDLFSIKWPGFDFSIGMAFVGATLAGIGLTIVGSVFELFHPPSQKGGNSKKIKVSKERKNDTK